MTSFGVWGIWRTRICEISQAHAFARALKLILHILKSPNLQTRSFVQCSDYVVISFCYIVFVCFELGFKDRKKYVSN